MEEVSRFESQAKSSVEPKGDAGCGLQRAMGGMQHFSLHPSMLMKLHVIGRGVGRGYTGQNMSLKRDPYYLRRGI